MSAPTCQYSKKFVRAFNIESVAASTPKQSPDTKHRVVQILQVLGAPRQLLYSREAIEKTNTTSCRYHSL